MIFVRFALLLDLPVGCIEKKHDVVWRKSGMSETGLHPAFIDAELSVSWLLSAKSVAQQAP